MQYCKICGKPIKVIKYSVPICSRACFYIDFWNETLDDEAIIINGECYHDGGYISNRNRYEFLGHAGRIFYIQKNTGERIKTNNLWYNGVIPPERHIKDNAKFVIEEEIDNGSY